MTKKLCITLIAVLFLSLSIVSPAGAGKTYLAERFDVQIDLQEDGSAFVTETVAYRFEGGPFTCMSASDSAGISAGGDGGAGASGGGSSGAG